MTYIEYADQKERVEIASGLLSDIEILETYIKQLDEDRCKVGTDQSSYRYTVIRKRTGYCNEEELIFVDEAELISFLRNHLQAQKDISERKLAEL